MKGAFYWSYSRNTLAKVTFKENEYSVTDIDYAEALKELVSKCKGNDGKIVLVDGNEYRETIYAVRFILRENKSVRHTFVINPYKENYGKCPLDLTVLYELIDYVAGEL